MKTNIVAPIGGVLILAGGIALSVYTATNAPVLEQTKEKLVKKYVDLSQKALAKGDLKEAEKMIKKAIVANPSSKLALSEYKKIILSTCPKVEAKPQQTKATPAPATPTNVAQPESDDSEEEMGCI